MGRPKEQRNICMFQSVRNLLSQIKLKENTNESLIPIKVMATKLHFLLEKGEKSESLRR